MRKVVLLCLVSSFGVISLHAKTPPKSADFSGTWILDMSQTKNVPDGLDSYRMVVTQDTQHLKVQTKLKGDLRTISSPDETSPQTRARVGPPGGYPGGEGPMGGPGMPAGGVGGPEVPVGGAGTIGGPGVPAGRVGPMGGPEMPVGGVGPMGAPGVPVGGGPMGEGIPGSTELSRAPGGQPHNKGQARAALAFSISPRSAVYKLNGSDSNVQLRDLSHTEATAKAAWMKGRSQLKLSLAGGESSERSGGGIAVKEQWRLSRDRQRLLLDRTVHTPGGSTTIHLVFNKQPTASGQNGT